MALTIFAERMKQARTKAGVKQKELADMVHVTPTTISAYEKADTNGNGKKPTLENAQKIANALSVSLDWMCGNDQSAQKSITEFSLQDYLKSIAIVLYEMSGTSEYDTDFHNATIHIQNPRIAYFCKQVKDLLVVYRNGVLTDEMYIDCVEKLIAGFKGYCFSFGNVLSYGESLDAQQFISNIDFNDNELGAGELSYDLIDYDNGYSRPVTLMVTKKDIWNVTEQKKEAD